MRGFVKNILFLFVILSAVGFTELNLTERCTVQPDQNTKRYDLHEERQGDFFVLSGIFHNHFGILEGNTQINNLVPVYRSYKTDFFSSFSIGFIQQFHKNQVKEFISILANVFSYASPKKYYIYALRKIRI